MKANSNIVAYIDAANLHKGIQSLGWELDYARFRMWLTHRFGAGRAYLFIGYLSKNKDLYTHLNDCGFSLVFKDIVFDSEGKVKGNCDADLIVRAMQESYEGEMEKAVIITSDGDYVPLVRFLLKKGQLLGIVSPSSGAKCSVLLRRTGAAIVYASDKRQRIQSTKKRPPAGTHPRKGPFHGE